MVSLPCQSHGTAVGVVMWAHKGRPCLTTKTWVWFNDLKGEIGLIKCSKLIKFKSNEHFGSMVCLSLWLLVLEGCQRNILAAVFGEEQRDKAALSNASSGPSVCWFGDILHVKPVRQGRVVSLGMAEPVGRLWIVGRWQGLHASRC